MSSKSDNNAIVYDNSNNNNNPNFIINNINNSNNNIPIEPNSIYNENSQVQPQLQSQSQSQNEYPKNYKSIIELQKEINHYKDKERVYKLLLMKKQQRINQLQELKTLYESIAKAHREHPKGTFRPDELSDVKTQKIISALKKIIEDKNSFLLTLEEELFAFSPQAVKFFASQLKSLQNENMRKYEGIQGSNIDNFKNENTNEKNKLNALLIKIFECQENINNLIKNLDEINDTNSFLKRK